MKFKILKNLDLILFGAFECFIIMTFTYATIYFDISISN